LYKNKFFDEETDNYDIEFIGIGMVSDDANEAYYIIVESKALQAFRKDAGLGKRDLHVTLGFKIEDIHQLSKAANTKI
jgi:2H phosphodiesterase-like protein